MNGVSDNNTDDITMSTSMSSLNSLQIALMSMKELCTKQQQKIDKLEQDKTELHKEIQKMHDANFKLREKNVSLSHEVHVRSKLLSETREAMARDRARNENNVKQIEKLQENILGGKFTASDEDDDNIASFSSCTQEIVNDNPTPANELEHNVATVSDDEIKGLCDKSKQSILDIKTSLVTQQNNLKAAIEAMKQKKTLSDQSAERLLSTVLSTVIARSAGDHVPAAGQPGVTSVARCCPMCEVVFPADCDQEEFESHVVEHFSYEESETLRNFDTVPDAYWPGIEHNPEM